MEESEEILLNSLQRCGVSLPASSSSIRDITSSTLVSICGQALNLIEDDRTELFSVSLPSSVADQIKICTSIAAAIKGLGYIGDLSFHKLLYPSEEDLYKVIRFLVERLSEASQNGRNNAFSGSIETQNVAIGNAKFQDKGDDHELDFNHRKVVDQFSDLRVTNEVTDWSNNNNVETTHTFSEDQSIREPKERVKLRSENPDVDGRDCKLRDGIIILQNQERVLMEEISAKSLELQNLEKELALLKEVEHMAFDETRSIDVYLKQLEEQIDDKKLDLQELKFEWVTEREILEKKRLDLEELLDANNPGVREKYRELREVEREKDFVLSEIRRREEEVSKLSVDLEGQPKQPSRSSYVDRVKEITKNSRKQDVDIEQILKRTRELQLESNSIRERLHRSHAVVEELVFREVRKDPLGKQAYRLLSSIHEGFEQISEKILATDRIRREAAEHEKKLAALATRRLSVEKLEADLDAIRRENGILEQNNFPAS